MTVLDGRMSTSKSSTDGALSGFAMGLQHDGTRSSRSAQEGLHRSYGRYFCQVVGVKPIDSSDGSANWWMFASEAGEIDDGLMARSRRRIQAA